MRSDRGTTRRGLALAALALGPTLPLTAVAADAPALAERPYGHVMGDGLAHSERAHGAALGEGLVSPATPAHDDGISLQDRPHDPLEAQVCAGPETLQGIDVSYYQGNIDWNAVANDGISFAWIRVSHSTQFFDPQFDANWTNARAAGIHTGVYQYFEPTEDPIAQADLLLEAMGPLQPGDMPPMIDVESADTVAPGAYADAIRAWLDHVEAATGVKPFIYTGYYYWNDNVGTDEFADHPLWIANYNAGCPLIPDYWTTWVVHQYCACESIAGISGDVDGDTFNGNLDDLMGFAAGGGVCGNGICTGGESPYDCPEDCPPCGVIGPDGGTIDNGDECYELYGPEQYWHPESAGQGGSLLWTNATEFDQASNYAIWRMYFEASGEYEVEVHIEPPWGESQQAAYDIVHAGGEAMQVVDQSASDGWVSLGAYQFTAATNHYVRLDDNTGELNDLEISIVYDALRVTRLDAPPEPGDTGSDPDGTTGSIGDTGLPGGTASGGDDTGGDTMALPGANDGAAPSGCGCRHRSSGGSGLWLLLLGLGLVRRRR